MKNVPYESSSGNVFAEMGFAPAAAAELAVKSTLIMTIGDTIKERSLHAAGSGATLRHRSTHTFQSPSRAHGQCDHRQTRRLVECVGAHGGNPCPPI